MHVVNQCKAENSDKRPDKLPSSIKTSTFLKKQHSFFSIIAALGQGRNREIWVRMSDSVCPKVDKHCRENSLPPISPIHMKKLMHSAEPAEYKN